MRVTILHRFLGLFCVAMRQMLCKATTFIWFIVLVPGRPKQHWACMTSLLPPTPWMHHDREAGREAMQSGQWAGREVGE